LDDDGEVEDTDADITA
jgi:hypothetical protein